MSSLDTNEKLTEFKKKNFPWNRRYHKTNDNLLCLQMNAKVKKEIKPKNILLI